MNNNEKINMYCVTNKRLKFLENFDYNLSWVGDDKYCKNYIYNRKKTRHIYENSYIVHAML